MGLPQTALIVDDEDHVRLYIKLILTQLGVGTIYEATNGQEALVTYADIRPDIVLMDVNMPVMDGIDALDHLNKMDPNVIVIMLTSLATREMVETSASKGAVQFIRKDVPRAAMSKVLQETFDECFE